MWIMMTKSQIPFGWNKFYFVYLQRNEGVNDNDF